MMPGVQDVTGAPSGRDMDTDPTSTVVRIFAEAESLPAGERREFLERHCADPAVRAELASLLDAHDRHQRFLADAARGQPVEHGQAHEPWHVSDGLVLGSYRLLRRIGEGGCGVVWLAERTDGVRRQVAIKVIKPGMDSVGVVARFRAESAILGSLEHPNIARIYDAGVTPSGLPYFVMEYIDGATITRYCDDHRLPIADRLALFARVCDAAHEAHARGVIHRDLKASNVMIRTDARGEVHPIIIDFGIAKSLSAASEPHSVFSLQGQFVGTPGYASPEQALGRAGVDTRSDIYSLGVLLYELLTGLLPFDREELMRIGPADAARLICTTEPPAPSARFASGGTEASADARGLDRAGLVRLLRQELEWIPMYAMRAEPERRYQSAAEMASDVRRYLAGEPLLAAPESHRYRVMKLIRRNRAIAVGLGIGVVALLLGTVVSVTWARIATAEAREASRLREDLLAIVVGGVDDLASEIQRTEASRGFDEHVRVLLRIAAGELPDSEDEVIPMLRHLRYWSEQSDPAGLARSLAARRYIETLTSHLWNSRHSDPEFLARAMVPLAAKLRLIGEQEAAIALLSRLLKQVRNEATDDHELHDRVLHELGLAQATMPSLRVEAMRSFQQALVGRQRRLPSTSPEVIETKVALLTVVMRNPQPDPALVQSLRDELMQVAEVEQVPSASRALLLAAVGAAWAMEPGLGAADKARQCARASEQVAQRGLGIQTREWLEARISNGRIEFEHGSPAAALELLRSTVWQCERTLGRSNPVTIEALLATAVTHAHMDSGRESIRLFESGYLRALSALGFTSPLTQRLGEGLIDELERHGRDEDVEYFRDTIVRETMVASRSGLINLSAAVMCADDRAVDARCELVTDPDPATNAQFGSSVAIDGRTMVVGAPGPTAASAAHVYEMREGSWQHVASLEPPAGVAAFDFGDRVALWNDVVVVSASRWPAHDVTERGAVFVFERRDQHWSCAQVLSAEDGQAFDRFGSELALHEDTLVVTAPMVDLEGDSDRGAVYVFKRDIGGWRQSARLIDMEGRSGDSFGRGVAVRDDTIAIGAPQRPDADAMGRVCVFSRTGLGWVQEPSLTAPELGPGSGFGTRVAIERSTLLVSAPRAGVAGRGRAGAVVAFRRLTGGWERDGPVLAAMDGAEGDDFGVSLAVSGDLAVVGAWQADVEDSPDHGAAHLYRRAPDGWRWWCRIRGPGSQPKEFFGVAVAITPTWLAVGSHAASAGGFIAAGYTCAMEVEELLRGAVEPDDEHSSRRH